jgi:hypothetical protein
LHCWQTPQSVPAGALCGLQLPAPSQLSGVEQAVVAPLPQAIPAVRFASSTHREDPVVQEVAPDLHGLGLVEQARLGVHALPPVPPAAPPPLAAPPALLPRCQPRRLPPHRHRRPRRLSRSPRRRPHCHRRCRHPGFPRPAATPPSRSPSPEGLPRPGGFAHHDPAEFFLWLPRTLPSRTIATLSQGDNRTRRTGRRM